MGLMGRDSSDEKVCFETFSVDDYSCLFTTFKVLFDRYTKVTVNSEISSILKHTTVKPLVERDYARWRSARLISYMGREENDPLPGIIGYSPGPGVRRKEARNSPSHLFNVIPNEFPQLARNRLSNSSPQRYSNCPAFENLQSASSCDYKGVQYESISKSTKVLVVSLRADGEGIL
jgi:hypothetical protein